MRNSPFVAKIPKSVGQGADRPFVSEICTAALNACILSAAALWMGRRSFLHYTRGEREGEGQGIGVLSTAPLPKGESPSHRNTLLSEALEQKKMSRLFNV